MISVAQSQQLVFPFFSLHPVINTSLFLHKCYVKQTTAITGQIWCGMSHPCYEIFCFRSQETNPYQLLSKCSVCSFINHRIQVQSLLLDLYFSSSCDCSANSGKKKRLFATFSVWVEGIHKITQTTFLEMTVFSDNTAFIKLSFSEAAEQCGKVSRSVKPVLFYTHTEEFYPYICMLTNPAWFLHHLVTLYTCLTTHVTCFFFRFKLTDIIWK